MRNEVLTNVVHSPDKPCKSSSPRATERTGSVTTERQPPAIQVAKTREFSIVFQKGQFSVASGPVRVKR
jgi:hypothetical protein